MYECIITVAFKYQILKIKLMSIAPFCVVVFSSLLAASVKYRIDSQTDSVVFCSHFALVVQGCEIRHLNRFKRERPKINRNIEIVVTYIIYVLITTKLCFIADKNVNSFPCSWQIVQFTRALLKANHLITYYMLFLLPYYTSILLHSIV